VARKVKSVGKTNRADEVKSSIGVKSHRLTRQRDGCEKKKAKPKGVGYREPVSAKNAKAKKAP